LVKLPVALRDLPRATTITKMRIARAARTAAAMVNSGVIELIM
jgi:hypothetical protein